MMRHLLVVGMLVLASLTVARAADQTVLGSALIVKDPSTAVKRKIIVKAKESASDDTLVGDPVANGATVTITLNGATPSAETYDLPAGVSPSTAKPFWTGDPIKGVKYKDPKGENGPVKSAEIKSNGVFQIKVALDGKLGPIAVVPPNPGSDGCVLLEITGGDSYSVQFASGQVTNKGAAFFKVAKPTSEGSCVPATTTTTTSSSTTTTIPLPFLTPPGDPPLRYRDLVFGSVTTTADVTYGSAMNGSGQTVTLKLDIYEPTGDSITARPAIVWVHGGSFSSGDKTSPELVDEANTFARKGYLNVSINYRLEPGGCSASGGAGANCITAMNEARVDAQTAVRFLRTNASLYRIDESRIAIGGSSAGAITALHVGFRSTENPGSAVGAAVSLSGANILSHVDAGDAPSMLFHGTADTVVPYQWAVDTRDSATAVGLDSFLTSWAGAGHVPYVQHRTEILDQTTNFLYWELDLTNAEQ